MNSVRCGSSFHSNPPAPSLLFCTAKEGRKVPAEKLWLSTPAWQSCHPGKLNTLGKGSTSTTFLLTCSLAPTANQLLSHLQVGWFACIVKQSLCFLSSLWNCLCSPQNALQSESGIKATGTCSQMTSMCHIKVFIVGVFFQRTGRSLCYF